MDFLKRIKFLGTLSFEKQLAIAVISCERAYREVNKIFPNALGQRIVFRKSIDTLWKYLEDKEKITTEELNALDLEIFKYVKDEFDLEPGKWGILFHPMVTSLARGINLSIGLIKWGLGEKSGVTSANVVENAAHIVDLIYDDLNDEGEMYSKEIGWLTNAIYLVVENERIPTDYNRLLENIPDYERGTISKTFEDPD